jgi:glycosyltransferase involved in cell wall biosynthesis
MKILHVIPSLSPSLGGPSQVALNLVKALRNVGIDTEIVTTNYDCPQVPNHSLGQKVDYRFTEDSAASVPVWFLPYNPPALKEFIFSKALTSWCWKNLHRYSLIDNHYLFSYAPACAAAIARWQGIPYTVRTMGQLTPWALAQGQRKKQLYAQLIERRNLNKAAVVHCTTEEEAKDVRSFGIQTPTVTLPLGVDSTQRHIDAAARVREKYRIDATTPIVLFLSRLHYKKRPDLLLQSLAQLKQAGLEFHCILAGSGESGYITELKQLTADLNLSDGVTFAGLIVGEEKDLLLQGSDLFALPSFSENFGIAVAEALLAGLPVVVTPGIQIAPEIARAQAGLVVAGEVEPLADAIAQLLNSAPLRAKLGRNGQQLAQSRYVWSAIAQDLAEVYQQIIDQNVDSLARYTAT